MAKPKPLKLLKRLKQNPQMKKIMEFFEDSSLSKLKGYYGLRAEQISKIAEPNVTEQIRLRVCASKKGNIQLHLITCLTNFRLFVIY